MTTPTDIGGLVLDTSVLDKITAELQPKAAKIVKTYGNMITASTIRRAPVDVGFLINSISANSKMIEPLTFRVQDGVAYGRRQELGFHGADSLGRIYHQPARPFMKPAVEEFRNKFFAAFAELFKP